MKILKQVSILILCAVLVVVYPFYAFAADPAANVKKDESVYLILHDDGSVDKQIVSVWLHSPDGLRNVKDVSSLKDIQSIKSDIVPTVSGTEVTWATDDTDVYYKGIGTGVPPVSVKISYTLNGKKMAAKDLLDKSGNISIQISITNNLKQTQKIDGKDKTIFAPVAAGIIIDLPTAVFSDVEAPNSMIVTEGTNQIVTFLAMPGMTDNFNGILDEQLGSIKNKISGELTITARAEGFKFPIIMGGAATNFSALKNIGNLNDTMGLVDGITQLFDAIDLLGGGTKSLSDGLTLYSSKMGEFNDGIIQAADGISQLTDGIQKLDDATTKLKDKINDELIPGIAEAQDTKKELSDKLAVVEQLFGELNLPELSDIQSELTDLIGQVCDDSSDATIKALTGKTYSQLTASQKAKISAARTQVKLSADAKIIKFMTSLDATKLVELIVKLKDLQSSASSMLGGMDTLIKALYNPDDDINNPTSLATAILALSAGADKLNDGAQQLTDGATQLLDGSSKLNSGSKQLASGGLELKNGFEKFSNKLLGAVGSLSAEDIRTALEVKDAMLKQADKYASYSGAPANAEKTLKFIIKVNEPEANAPAKAPAQNEVKVSFWARIVNWWKGIFA